MDKTSGVFKKYGSIFKDGKTNTSRMTRTTGSPDDVHYIFSVEVNEVEFDAGAIMCAFSIFREL